MKTCNYCDEERKVGDFVHERKLGEICRLCYIDWLEENHPEAKKVIDHHKTLAEEKNMRR